MRGKTTLIVALLLEAAASGCAVTPATVSSTFAPPGSSAWPMMTLLKPGSYTPGFCRVRIGAILDKRSDTVSMGNIGLRIVRTDDVIGWVRTGLMAIVRDPRIAISAVPDGPAGVVLDVDILKAYVFSITTEKTANVVLRVRYRVGDAPAEEQTLRGVDVAANWVTGAGEAESALESALAQVIVQLDRGVLARCHP